MAIEREGAAWFILLENELQGSSYLSHSRITQRRFAVERCVARGEQQQVAVAKRHVEDVRQLDQHLAARSRPAALQEAQVSSRDPGVECELELGQAARFPPTAQGPAPGGSRSAGRCCEPRFAMGDSRGGLAETVEPRRFGELRRPSIGMRRRFARLRVSIGSPNRTARVSNRDGDRLTRRHGPPAVDEQRRNTLTYEHDCVRTNLPRNIAHRHYMRLAIRHADANADLTELHVPPIPRHRVQYEHGLTWRVDHLGVWDEARGRCSAANYSDDYCEGERNVLHR